jgi:phosphoglycerol transferase MdoB-like AlkP superfamily enzyme
MFAADHNTRVKGHDLIPIHKFRIPGMLIGPNVPKMSYPNVCSNIDLLPTILHYMELEGDTPLLGRDLMNLPKDDPGRAIMQYGKTFGYRIGDEVSIIRPYAEIVNFTYKDKTLHPIEPNQTLNDQALAHALLSWLIYKDRAYKVDAETTSESAD